MDSLQKTTVSGTRVDGATELTCAKEDVDDRQTTFLSWKSSPEDRSDLIIIDQ